MITRRPHDGAALSATAAPAEARSRVVNRLRGGTAATDSVNDLRGQPSWSQRQRRLLHTNSGRRPAT